MSTTRTSPNSQAQRGLSRGFNIAAIVAAGAIAYLTFQHLLTRASYNKGERAYEAGNCEVAIAQFDRAIDRGQLVDLNDYVDRARARKVECQAFQSAIKRQETGEFAAALVAYDDFVNRYPNGALVEPSRQQTANLFEQPGLAALAQPNVCERMDALIRHELIPQPETNLPSFYHACGQTYAAARDHTKAVNMYERFLDRYPEHQLASEVKTALAQSMVADTKAKGAGNILQPERSGITSPGSTVLVIQNDSPEKMRLIFSGPEPRFEELEPCTDCQKYIGERPETCPNKGPIGRYTLKPGQYDVVVKSISDRGVRPFTGNWALGDGSEYNSCFFIVQQPTPEAE